LLNVSVIIPSLDRPFFLKKILNQLCFQTVKPFEILVINHVSDRKLCIYTSIVNTFKSKAKVRQILNRRPSLARSYNLGIKLAKGDVILFLDDNPILDHNLVEEHIKTYVKEPRVCGVQGKVVSLRKKNLEQLKWRRKYPWRQIFPGMEKYVFP